MKQTIKIITTSWDDGHPLDLYLAEKLSKYGIKGTFFIPVQNPERPVMKISEIRNLREMGMEIGAHTVTHCVLPGHSEDKIKAELEEGKKFLEDILGEEIYGFCYPKGKFSKKVKQLVQKSGYRYARTTISFCIDINDPYLMPTSFQLFPHSRITHIRHALKEFNYCGLKRWLLKWKAEIDLLSLTHLILKDILKEGGVFHLWGHSWEIQKMELWHKLDDILRILIEYSDYFEILTNNETILRFF